MEAGLGPIREPDGLLPGSDDRPEPGLHRHLEDGIPHMVVLGDHVLGICNLWSKIIHSRKSGLHIDIVVESM